MIWLAAIIPVIVAPAHAQVADAARIGIGALAVRGALGTCIRHKVLCGTAIVAGGVAGLTLLQARKHAEDANGQAVSSSIPKPQRPARGCTAICRADANDNIPGNMPTAGPPFAMGEATAPNCPTAVKEAKRLATHRLGAQPKHIDCRTSEG